MYKLFATLTRLGVIVLSLLFTPKAYSLPTEYVFTAPPEVDLEMEEIPSQDEYPLYECSNELENEEVLDSHNCSCVDCEDTVSEPKQEKELTLQNQQDRE